MDKRDDISKISVIGVGMRTHSGVASKMFKTLAANNINIAMISTSEIKVSCVIDLKYTELAVRVLHEAFGLAEQARCHLNVFRKDHLSLDKFFTCGNGGDFVNFKRF